MADLSKHIATEIGSAKAWLKYKQTTTPAIGDDYNITSVADDAAGQFTVTTANDMASAAYTVICQSMENVGSLSKQSTTGGHSGAGLTVRTAGVFQIETRDNEQTLQDSDFATTASHGDLA